MRVSRIVGFLFGVTLSVAPIFSSVWAQQSNQQADLLMEMQALRAEIAELRDMVERQQHQVSQMQRAAQTAGARPPAALDSRYQVTPETQQPGIDAQPGLPSTSPQTQYPGTPPAGSAGEPIDPPGDEEVAPAFADDEADFYLPYQPDQPGEIIRQRTSDDVVIEERVISQPPMVTSRSDRPPVEERTIGQPASPSADRPVADTAFQTGSPDTPTNDGLAPTSAGNAPGVIAVPGTAAGANDQQYPNQQSLPTESIGSAGEGAPNPVYQQQPQQPTITAVPQVASAGISAVLSEQDYYQQGFELLKQSKHTQAVDIFKQQIASYPQGGLADDAHYWIAESMYVNRALDGSKRYFKAIIENFQQSPRLPDAMLKTAYIEQEQGNRIEARILLQEIIQYHPRSNAAISAKNRLAELE